MQSFRQHDTVSVTIFHTAKLSVLNLIIRLNTLKVRGELHLKKIKQFLARKRGKTICIRSKGTNDDDIFILPLSVQEEDSKRAFRISGIDASAII